MDGFQVFRKIQELDPDLPIVALTPVAEAEQREKALKAGFCDYFVKPILEIAKFCRPSMDTSAGARTLPSRSPPDPQEFRQESSFLIRNEW
jgi:CheY-like chemotaxis protein